MSDGPELDPEDVRIGLMPLSAEKRALMLIGRVRNDGIYPYGGRPKYNLPRVCTRGVLPLPDGCWSHGNRSPYAMYFDDRWCDECIAYAALNNTLPKPEQTITVTRSPRIVGAAS